MYLIVFVDNDFVLFHEHSRRNLVGEKLSKRN